MDMLCPSVVHPHLHRWLQVAFALAENCHNDVIHTTVHRLLQYCPISTSQGTLPATVLLVSDLNSVVSSYFTAVTLIDRAKYVSEFAAISTSSKRSECAPPTTFLNGPSHKMRSPTTFTLCRASLLSRLSSIPFGLSDLQVVWLLGRMSSVAQV